MATEIGMDADQVRGFAAKLDSSAQALTSVISGVNVIVSGLSHSWVGPDAEEFVGWWTNQHRPALQNAHDSVVGLATSARNNATEQDTASGGGSQGGPGTSPTVRNGPAVPNHTLPNASPASAAPTPTGSGYSSANFQGGGDQFLADWKRTPSGYDQWNFGYMDPAHPGTGDCTSFVAWRLNQLAHSKGLDWSFSNNAITGQTGHLPGGALGNASQWGTDATSAGFPPNSNPSVGSVAWYGSDAGGVGSAGHVAIVTGVNPDGSITIEQSSYDGAAYSTQAIAAGAKNYPSGFIHFLPGT